MLLFAKYKLCSSSAREHLRNLSIAVVNSIVIVVSSLNSLMSNQISRLRLIRASGIKASVINTKQCSNYDICNETDKETGTNVEIDLSFCEDKLRNGCYNLLFAHLETLISSDY